MFGRKKDEGGGEKSEGEARPDATAPLPLRSRAPQAGANLTPAARAPVSRPEAPRRAAEMPGGSSLRPDQPGGDDAKKLIVGREIFLNGEINSCDRLVVEGRVEANMKDCREIEIAESGTFKGQVEIERADISGVFEGDLTAREHLVVRATGRITGKVRFGELEIERGGQIVGDVQVFGEKAAPSRDTQFTVDTPAE
jgi:cytoskeletal protein CcmA (bactofilin family)